MKAIKLLSAIGFALFCGVFGWQFGRHCGVEPQINKAIPTIEEIQVLIGAVPDGIIGKETLTKWDRAICNQNAEPFFEQNNE